jgi:hypothetical protein
MATAGTATIDFGSTPIETATVLVSGLSGLSVATHKEAFFQDDDSTVGNDASAHRVMRMFAKCGCEFVSATSMNINVYMSDGGATGQFIVHWVIS